MESERKRLKKAVDDLTEYFNKIRDLVGYEDVMSKIDKYVVYEIIKDLSPAEVGRLEQTNKYFNRMIKKVYNIYWKNRFLEDFWGNTGGLDNNNEITQETKESLDRLSVKPGDPNTYWKRLYEVVKKSRYVLNNPIMLEGFPYIVKAVNYDYKSFEGDNIFRTANSNTGKIVDTNLITGEKRVVKLNIRKNHKIEYISSKMDLFVTRKNLDRFYIQNRLNILKKIIFYIPGVNIANVIMVNNILIIKTDIKIALYKNLERYKSGDDFKVFDIFHIYQNYIMFIFRRNIKIFDILKDTYVFETEDGYPIGIYDNILYMRGARPTKDSFVLIQYNLKTLKVKKSIVNYINVSFIGLFTVFKGDKFHLSVYKKQYLLIYKEKQLRVFVLDLKNNVVYDLFKNTITYTGARNIFELKEYFLTSTTFSSKGSFIFSENYVYSTQALLKNVWKDPLKKPFLVSCKVCSAPPIFKCGNCLKVLYCSRDCQLLDWTKNNHKINCV